MCHLKKGAGQGKPFYFFWLDFQDKEQPQLAVEVSSSKRRVMFQVMRGFLFSSSSKGVRL